MHSAYGKLMGLASPALRVVAIDTRCSLSSSRKLFRFSPLTAHRVVRRGYAESKLDLLALDRKWRERWAESPKQAHPAPNGSKPSKYILPMFPYPSGSLHLGHLRVYAIADVLARYNRLKGYDVMLPMGWDSFGLPAENAAMERGIDPAAWTRSNIAKMKEQLRLINGSWDWSRELSTCDPEFYKHTQRIFLKLHEMGLAYQAEAEVNYDPVDKTVLANEQVDDNGCSWRSGAKVEKRQLKQWFLRITEYRDSLLKDLETLDKDNAWPERVLAMQKNWLGKSTGAMIKFPLMVYDHTMQSAIEVFTTRPDTLFGVQYLALAASHPVVSDLAAKDPELQAFLDTLPGLPPGSKVGYMLPHLRAVNPLAYHEDTPDATKASIPIYVAPYVLGDYGQGAVMGVPGHDHRDHAFWKEHHYDEPIRVVLAASEDESTTAMLNEPFVDHGFMTEHSGPFRGKSSSEAGRMLISMLEGAGLAEPVEKWRIRDWLISRQRYWGTPIPIVHCGSCGPVPVPEDQLPVTLPEVTDHFTQGMTGNPLESAHDWINTTCPTCGGAAKRDTDTMDTFVDSSWYYMRFIDPHNDTAPFSPERAKAMLPVDLYFGGIEHAILHLLYARFIYKALMESSLVYGEDEVVTQVQEPFRRLVTQGMVHGKTYVDVLNGRFLKPDELDLSDSTVPIVKASGQPAAVTYAKMSKSKYNGVDPTGIIAKHGSDATRAHMIFQAPVSDVLNWDEEKIAGVTRWLARLYDVALKARDFADERLPAKEQLEKRSKQVESMNREELVRWDADMALWRALQSTIRSVTASYDEVYSLNTIVSDLMSLTNTLIDSTAATPAIQKEVLSSLLRMLAPITPAYAEECWTILHPSSPALFDSASFPSVDSMLDHVQPRSQTSVVQVNGKLRCTVEIPQAPSGISGDELKKWAVSEIMKTEQGKAKLSGGSTDITKAKKIIVVRGGQLVNFVF